MSFKLKALYFTTLVFCIIEFLSFSGVIYGWGALVYVLKQEGYFADDCPGGNSTGLVKTNDTSGTGCGLNQEGCAKQDASLNLVFTISAFTLQGSSFFWGMCYDKLGTRLTRILLSVIEVCGCLLIAFSSKELSIMIFPAMACLAAGGIAVLIANMQVSNLFGHRKSTIMTGLSGCFDTSSSVMLFVKLAYEAGISLRTSFFFLAGCTLLFNINTFILLPSKHIPWPLPPGYMAIGGKEDGMVEIDEQKEEDQVMMDNVHANNEHSKATSPLGVLILGISKLVCRGGSHGKDETRSQSDQYGAHQQAHQSQEILNDDPTSSFGITKFVRGKTRGKDRTRKRSDQYQVQEVRFDDPAEAEQKKKQDESESRGKSMEAAEAARNADYPSLKACLLSPLFMLALMYIAILQLRMIFFLGTFNPWLEALTECDEKRVSLYTTVFVFCQSTGLIFSPLCGLLLDRNKSKANMSTRGPYADLLDSALAFALTSALFGLFSITILIPVLEVQFLTFFLHVVTRAFLYSLVASATPIFFPIQYFGTIYGLLIGLGGIFGLLQYPLFLVWTNLLNNDPFYVNIGLLLLCGVTFSLPAYIVVHVKRKSVLGVPIHSN